MTPHRKSSVLAQRAAKFLLAVLCGLSYGPFALAADPITYSGSHEVQVTLSGSNIADYLIAETPNFLFADWAPFTSQGILGYTNGGQAVEMMVIPFIVSPGDGQKTLYIKYRNAADVQSETLTTLVSVDEANSCVEEPVTGCEGLPLTPLSANERTIYKLGVSPTHGMEVPVNFIYPGDYVRTNGFDTVYCITENLERRPFIDETTFFTQTRTFLPVKWTTDETISLFPLSYPMLPRENVTLLKFESDNKIYHFVQDPQNPNHGILHWITTQELAEYIAGPNWNEYVIDLNPVLTDRFDFSAPFLTVDDVLAAEIDVAGFRKRELLNESGATAEDPGVESSLLQVTRQFFTEAGTFIIQGFTVLADSFKKK